MKYLFIFFLCSVSFLNAQTGTLNFDGINDYVEIENTAFNAIGTDDFTIEFWINGNNTSQSENPVIFSNRSSANEGIKVYFKDKNGNPGAHEIAIILGGTDYVLESYFDLNRYYCYHFAIAKNDAMLTFYRNGSQIGTKEILNSPVSVSSQANILLGKDVIDSTKYNGLIGGLRIWNKVVTPNDLKIVRKATPDFNTLNLIAYWDFRAEIGQNIVDLVGNSSGQLGSSLFADDADPLWLEFGSLPRVSLGNDTVLQVSAPYEFFIQNPDNASFYFKPGNIASGNFILLPYNYEPGTYWVEARNECGVNFDSINIFIEPALYIPNTFTPDGNSLNGMFQPYFNVTPTNFNFIIYNRDRQVMFQSFNHKIGWDGTFNGALAPQGVYIWLVQFSDATNNQIIEQKGTVNLLR